MSRVMSRQALVQQGVFHWTGRFFYFAAFAGLMAFGTYIILRATGMTAKNFHQWNALVKGLPLQTAADWISNVGIGMHYLMGTILVLAWPILFSPHIRARHRAIHRWTGRTYVTAGFLAGVGGLSFILARHNGGAPHIAFAIWGSIMMLSAVLTFVRARARRFDQHRAWAIRLFAMVLGSWLYDLEVWTWRELAGGIGMTKNEDGPADYVIMYFFFVPNLLVAEFFIRSYHKRMNLRAALKWPLWAAVAITALIFVCSIGFVTATHEGKYGRHLLELISG